MGLPGFISQKPICIENLLSTFLVLLMYTVCCRN